MIWILAAGLLLHNLSSGPASFCTLHQEGLRLHMTTYALTPSGPASHPASERVVTLDMGEGKPEDWFLQNALGSPDGRWLALLETTNARQVRGLVLLDMLRLRQVWRKTENGYWSGGGWIRWSTNNHLAVVREVVVHTPQNESTVHYGVDTYAAPEGSLVAQRKPVAGDRWAVLLSPESAEWRRGAAKLLNFFGYSPPLRPESASADSLLDYLNGEQGAIAADGKALACLVFKRPRAWSLGRSRLYQNTFVWAWRSRRRSTQVGWRMMSVPLAVEEEEYPHGVWLWKQWLVVAAGFASDHLSLHFFRRSDVRHHFTVPGNLFIPKG